MTPAPTAAALSLTSTANVAAVVQYLSRKRIGTTGTTVAFTATIGGVAHTYVYEQLSTGAAGIERQLSSGRPSERDADQRRHERDVADFGRADRSCRRRRRADQPRAQPTPADHVGAVTVTVCRRAGRLEPERGQPQRRRLLDGRHRHVGALSIASPADYAGAMAFHVTMSWTNADGSSGIHHAHRQRRSLCAGQSDLRPRRRRQPDRLVCQRPHGLRPADQP